MTEIKVAEIVAEYEGKKQMLKLASEEMYRNLQTNKAGETSAEALLSLNEWIERMEDRIRNTMISELLKIQKGA